MPAPGSLGTLQFVVLVDDLHTGLKHEAAFALFPKRAGT